MPADLRITTLLIFMVMPMIAQAQMAPTVSRYTQPSAVAPATVPPMAGSAANNTVPPQPQTVSNDYVWFGNDQTNEAVRLIRANRPVEALEVVDDITRINMRLPEAHLLRGVAYLQMKDLARAEQSFNTVLAIDRGYLGAYVYLADIALQRGNTKQVEVYLQAIRAVALTEDCAEYRFVKNSLRSVPIASVNP